MYVGANDQMGLQAAVQEARSCTGIKIRKERDIKQCELQTDIVNG